MFYAESMIDAHAHVTFDAFDGDREDVVLRARDAGVSGWIEIGTSVERSREAIDFAGEHDGVFATVGVHPHGVANMTEDSWSELERLSVDDVVKGIGEVGFDLYRNDNFEEQREALVRFIDLAVRNDFPIVFHMRNGESVDVHDKLIDLLSSYSESERPRGVVHTFSGTAEQAEEYLELGMYLSVSGVITFKNAGAMADAARTAPINRLLIETDCPFLAPEPHRGERNEPAYVRFVADRVAELRGISSEEVQKVTEETTGELFGF